MSTFKSKKKKNKSDAQFATDHSHFIAPPAAEIEELLQHYQSGNLTLSEQHARNITQNFPNHPVGWKILGMVLKAQGLVHEPLKPLQRAVELSPNDPDIHYNLGIVFNDLGQKEAAAASYRTAIRQAPTFVPAHYNLSLVLNDLGQVAETVMSCREVVRLKPDFAQAHYNLAIALFKIGRHAEAEGSCRAAIRLAPDYAPAHYNLGVALNSLGRFAEAEISYRQAIRLRQDYAQAYSNLGVTLLNLERYSEAELCCRDAIRLQPNFVEAYTNLAVALIKGFFKLGRYEEAELSCREAIRLKPDYAQAHSNLGVALFKQGRLIEAKASYREAIRLSPTDEQAHNNLGLTLNDLGQFSEAENAYQEAIRLNPDYAEAYSNLGVTLFRLGRFSEAESYYQEAIRLQPDYAPAYHNKSHLDLLLGSLEEGWQNNEWRRRLAGSDVNRSFSTPLWSGAESLSGKTILVYSELHLGDTIQMCRYLKKLLQQGAIVLFAPHKQLYALMRGLDKRIELVSLEDKNLQFDFHCPMMSLPLAFKTNLQTIPSDTPYLFAEEDRIKKWKERIGGEGFKIGICWGGSHTAVKAGRTFPLHLFSEISKIQGIRLISIHKGEGEKELESLPTGMKVEVLGDDFDAGDQAFLDTAAVMKCCDLIITSDTAITVLGGALSVPTWIGLKKVPHWFWMLDRNDSPWYPSIRLFRQNTQGDWESVFTEIRLALLELIRTKNGSPHNGR